MLLIYCPYCEEERSELEFRQAGDAHIARPTNMTEMTDEEFEAFFFLRDNVKGLTFERWRHLNGCGRFFNAARDTVSDKFLTTYKAGLPRPDVSTLRPAASAPVEAAPVETYEATESDAK